MSFQVIDEEISFKMQEENTCDDIPEQIESENEDLQGSYGYEDDFESDTEYESENLDDHEHTDRNNDTVEKQENNDEASQELSLANMTIHDGDQHKYQPRNQHKTKYRTKVVSKTLHPNQARSNPIRNLRPDPFTGKADFHEYITHFKLCAEMSGWDNRTKAQMLAFSLRDDARRYFTTKLT
jgi:hypothetical protein